MKRKASKFMERRKKVNPNQLRSLFEGSQRLGVSYWALYRGIEAGLIKAVRLGGRIMISESELSHLAEFGFGPGRRSRKRKLDTAVEAR